MTRPTTYHHTQNGPWSLVLLAIAGIMLATTVVSRREPVVLVICPSVAALMLFLAACFHGLTVADEGDRLAVRFGPLPVARQSILYADILSVEPGRTLILDGWGIHMSPRGGWVWNIYGRDCLVIRHGNHTLRLGTDDAPALLAFLQARIGAVPR